MNDDLDEVEKVPVSEGVTLLRRLVSKCDEFEAAWRSGNRPTIENYLSGVPESDRKALFGRLLELEFELRRGAGELPASDEYHRRFPEFAPIIDEVFADSAPPTIDYLEPAQSVGEIGRLGAYRISKVLGAGGMGVVFAAEDHDLGRKVAVKTMLPALAANPPARRRFLQEARAAAAVEHDNIVPIYQVGESNGVPYFAMPLLKGESLDQRLKREKMLPITEVLRIGRETALGLGAAHAANLVHRDIKPANLWLEAETGRVKILDFGLARAQSNDGFLTKQGMVVGTPWYMSPEQASGQSVDDRSDLFSLGSVLYRMATGRLPFQAADALSTLVAVATQDPPNPSDLRSDIPPPFAELVMRLLHKDPARRPKSAHVVVRLIREIELGQENVADARVNRQTSRGRAAASPSKREKPDGCTISERKTSEGMQLSWPLQTTGYTDSFRMLIPTALILLPALHVFWQIYASRHWQPSYTTLITFLPVLLIFPSLRYFRRPYPESITLAKDRFYHNLGQMSGSSHWRGDYAPVPVGTRQYLRRLVGLPQSLELEKNKLGKVALQKVGDRLRIRYHAGVYPVEIGRLLQDQERKWLISLIRRWQTED